MAPESAQIGLLKSWFTGRNGGETVLYQQLGGIKGLLKGLKPNESNSLVFYLGPLKDFELNTTLFRPSKYVLSFSLATIRCDAKGWPLNPGQICFGEPACPETRPLSQKVQVNAQRHVPGRAFRGQRPHSSQIGPFQAARVCKHPAKGYLQVRILQSVTKHFMCRCGIRRALHILTP